jgi:phospholipid/cholesterol/gamma-HCH transport system substrate-binding protein
MRRLLASSVLLAAAIALIALIAGPSAQGSGDYKFDVIFDDARGLIGGQLVKIAGAKAGQITDVTVTPDFKARISATIEGRFKPFYTNAKCTIRPEGLIAENYIDCDPGNTVSGGTPLNAQGGFPPTVPVTNTTEPVSLLNLFNMFNLPTRQRFMVIIDELGIGTAGEGADFNDILRRANPALGLADKVIGILNRQRGQLASLIDSTNTIAAEAATHTTSLQSFLDQAARLSTTTAAHSGNLSLAIQRLPGLLAAATPALQRLDTVAVNSTPLVQELHASAPTLNKVAADLKPFVRAAKPGLAKLSAALDKAIPAIKLTTPLIKTLNTYLKASLPNTRLMGKLFTNLQATGFAENLLSVFYYGAATVARYDGISHLIVPYFIAPNNGACGTYATTPVAGCSAHYGSAPTYTPVAASKDSHRAAHHAQPAAQPTTSAPATTAPSTTTQKPLSPLQTLVAQETALAKKLISKLVQGGGQATGKELQALQGALQGNGQNSLGTLQSLTSYLLK